MENEINYEIVHLGQKAQRVIESEDFKDVIEHIHADLFKKFRTTNIANEEDREALHKLSHSLEYLQMKIKSYADAAAYELKTKTEKDEDE